MIVTSVFLVGFSTRTTGPNPAPVTSATALCSVESDTTSVYRFGDLPQS